VLGGRRPRRLTCELFAPFRGIAPQTSAAGEFYSVTPFGLRLITPSNLWFAMDVQLTETARQWANDILVWIGFGTLVGLMAKAVMPGRDPGGAVATLFMGIGGTIIGCGVVTYFNSGQRITPISPLGFVVATGGAFILLVFYRLLAGRYFIEGDRGMMMRAPRAPRASRSRGEYVRIDD